MLKNCANMILSAHNNLLYNILDNLYGKECIIEKDGKECIIEKYGKECIIEKDGKECII